MTTYRVARSAHGRTFDVLDSRGRLVEGGFFSKQAAMSAARQHERDTTFQVGDRVLVTLSSGAEVPGTVQDVLDQVIGGTMYWVETPAMAHVIACEPHVMRHWYTAEPNR